MKILLFGGTTEGRVLASKLVQLGVAVTVSVATPLGKEELIDIAPLAVLVGRKGQVEMEPLVREYDCCIDATHPYAVEASKTIAAACAASNVPLRRLLRAQSAAAGVLSVANCRQAAEFLLHKDGNVLLATGAKELSEFSLLDPSRLFARVLPTHEGITACEKLGIAHKNILALQGPFTREMNTAMLRQYHIAWMVTKDGGAAGGFAEKLAAARNAQVQLLLIERPDGQGESLQQIYESIREELQ
ncbi:MAG: precorrin-6A reductase [Pygmaiobacter sp.]